MFEESYMLENKHYFGSLFSIPDLRDYRATTSKVDFPDAYQLTMPEVKNQGQVGSCVAHSLSTVTEYFNKKETGRDTKMSTGYIYGNRLYSLHKGVGMYVRDALKTLTKYGNVQHKDFPENVEVPTAIDLFDSKVDELEDAGLEYKIASYFRLKDDNAIKAQLLDNNPVVFCMHWFNDIKIEDGIMITDEVKTFKTGRHCMVIYGWNDRGWLVQNSWGARWGNHGRFILPYNVTRRETWGVTDADASSSLILEKPFKSKFGSFIAKALHNLISVFYNLINKLKKE